MSTDHMQGTYLPAQVLQILGGLHRTDPPILYTDEARVRIYSWHPDCLRAEPPLWDEGDLLVLPSSKNALLNVLGRHFGCPGGRIVMHVSRHPHNNRPRWVLRNRTSWDESPISALIDEPPHVKPWFVSLSEHGAAYVPENTSEFLDEDLVLAQVAIFEATRKLGHDLIRPSQDSQSSEDR